MISTLIFIAVCFLAYINGANDNFKGVAMSTTQSSGGSLLGLGVVTGKPVLGVIASWVMTLPCAARFAALGFISIRHLVAP